MYYDELKRPMERTNSRYYGGSDSSSWSVDKLKDDTSNRKGKEKEF